MKKLKGQTVDLLYLNKKENNKKKPKKVNKRNKKKVKEVNENDTEIDLDNEIIIGLTPKREEKEKQINRKNKKRKTNKSQAKRKQTKNVKTKKPQKAVNNTTPKKENKKRKRKLKIIKWTSLILLLIGAITLFLLSSIFNIKQIIVINNKKISSQEIINLSTLTVGTNMFKITNETIIEGIKTNPYIEDVEIKRNITGKVTLEIKERVPTYMLSFANAYVYINNQGYMLEISEEKIKAPIIIGFATPADTIKEGNRLIVEDLKKLEDVIKIMESAKSNSMADMITEIDISDAANYKLKIESESKTVQFGGASDINIKLLKIKSVMEQTKGKTGEIYFQNSERTVFKEDVKR